jgi:hypothetical protein
MAELRRMVLLLETADVLEGRARRAGDPAQVAVLLRRAEQRRRDAAQLRERLAARGAALPAPDRAASARAATAEQSPRRQQAVSRGTPPVGAATHDRSRASGGVQA